MINYPLPTPLDDPWCGNCRNRLRRWGDWLCLKCREEVDAMWEESYHLYRVAMQETGKEQGQ